MVVRFHPDAPILALVSLVVEVLFCNQGVEVRFLPGAPILSRIRLAAIPPRLGRGFRVFESHLRDQYYGSMAERSCTFLIRKIRMV